MVHTEGDKERDRERGGEREGERERERETETDDVRAGTAKSSRASWSGLLDLAKDHVCS